MKARLKSLLRGVYYRGLQMQSLRHRRTLLYLKGVRSWPDFSDPHKFTEKVNWRILNDRRELLEATCDKDAMKDHARSVAGGLIRVPETLWLGTNTGELVGLSLPKRWVLKPNHRAGRVYFGNGSVSVSAADDLEDVVSDWLQDVNGETFGEWAYTKARKSFLLEEFIGAGDEAPSDYKIYVFDGRAHLIQYHDGRFSNHSCTYYDRSWMAIPVKNRAYELAPDSPAPDRLADMLHAAEIIAAGFDFMRVDLYYIDGEIWFGEVSPYPAGGISRFDPPEFDENLGREWKLPDLV